MELGAFLRKHRLAKGLTLAGLAKETGISRPYLTQIEGGSAKGPSEQKLRKIAVALDVPLATLLALANQEIFTNDYVQEALDYSELHRKISALQQLIDKTLSEGPDLIAKYNFLTVVDEDLGFLRNKLAEIAEKHVPRKYPTDVEVIIEELLPLEEKGRRFIREQIRIFKTFFNQETAGKEA